MFCQDCFCLQNYPLRDSCFFASYVGNGVCDDLANTEACSYDGGNCFLKAIKMIFFFFSFAFFFLLGDCCSIDPKAYENCKVCQCLYDPRELMSSAQTFPQHKCSYQSSPALGDGFCHDELNNPACNFDNGDCCSPIVYTNVCQQCKCHDNMKSASVVKKKKACGVVSQAALKLIDRCEDHLNVPECDYSNKQCCGKANMHFCHDCVCLDPRNTEKRGTNFPPFS